MSFDSARRRFVVVADSGSAPALDRWLRFSPATCSLCLALWRCAQAAFLLAALVMGTSALVESLDLLLDRLHDWI